MPKFIQIVSSFFFPCQMVVLICCIFGCVYVCVIVDKKICRMWTSNKLSTIALSMSRQSWLHNHHDPSRLILWLNWFFLVQHTSISPDRKLITVVGDHLHGLLVDSHNGKVWRFFWKDSVFSFFLFFLIFYFLYKRKTFIAGKTN